MLTLLNNTAPEKISPANDLRMDASLILSGLPARDTAVTDTALGLAFRGVEEYLKEARSNVIKRFLSWQEVVTKLNKLAYEEERKILAKYIFIAVSIFLVFIVYGMIKISSFNPSDKEIRVGIVQPDINPWKKWELGNLQNLVDNYLELSQQAVNDGAQIILWPETALPVYLVSSGYRAELDSIYNFLEENNFYIDFAHRDLSGGITTHGAGGFVQEEIMSFPSAFFSCSKGGSDTKSLSLSSIRSGINSSCHE